jgi:hypothetical protein
MIIPVTSGQGDKATIHLNDSIQIDLYRVKFDSSGKKLEYLSGDYLIAVNNQLVFGIDGDLPMYKLSKAILAIGKNKYNLNVENMYNPWVGYKPFENSLECIVDRSNIKIRALFSDGAGTYCVEWMVKGNSSARTILTNDEEIMFGYFKR